MLDLVAAGSHSPDRSAGELSMGGCYRSHRHQTVDAGRLCAQVSLFDDRDDDHLEPEEDDEEGQVDRKRRPREDPADRAPPPARPAGRARNGTGPTANPGRAGTT